MDRWIGRGRDSASMPSILGNGEALEERVNCDELGWGGEREVSRVPFIYRLGS